MQDGAEGLSAQQRLQPEKLDAASGAACDAAVAVRLAREHNRGEEMEEWLYTHQAGMTPATVRQAAREIGQVTDFDAKYAATLELVKADVALGTQLDISSTPTFFINGVKVEGQWAPQYFDQAIAYELQHAACPDKLVAERDAGTRHVRAHQGLRVGFWRKRPYRALDRLTLEVREGEVFGFLGPNGAGKTTTLKLLMQLVFPTAGRAEILGRPLGDLAVKRRIGYLPENPYFYDYLTAEELLTYFGALFGYDAAERRRRAGRLLDEVGIGARTAAAAPQVFERHAAARRHRAGAPQRSRARDFRRADVRPRSAGPPRRPRAHPAACATAGARSSSARTC